LEQGKKFIGNARANYGRHCFGSRMPPVSSRLLAYDAVCAIGAERGVDVTGNGVYRRVSLNLAEMNTVMQKAHPACTPLKILERFKSKIVGNATCDAYYTVPGSGEVLKSSIVATKSGENGLSSEVTKSTTPELSSEAAKSGEPESSSEATNSIGWHSDPGAGAIIQVLGCKQLKIGGIHIVPEGSAGDSVALESLPPDSLFRNVLLQPNAIVGFAPRQIHCLTCSQEKNLSLSFAIEELI
jgi:hypothetical protein